MTGEDPQARIKRLYMRSIRRGIKEMDLILGSYAKDQLATLGADDLELYDELLSENDHDLYNWVCGQTPAPSRFYSLIAQISDHLQSR